MLTSSQNMLNTLVKNYLVNIKQKEAALFDKPDLQIADLTLDSLDMVEMLFEIEDKCGFQLDDPMRYLKMSYQDMLDDIERQIRAHNNGEMIAL